MKLFWRIVLFVCCLASFLVSLQIFYHQGIAADELSLSAAQLFGGNRWLLAAWLRMFLLFIASTVSFLQLFFTKMNKKTFLCGIILCTAILNGCAQGFLGDGRGDIKIPLKDAYYIFEVNSTRIDFCKKSPEGSYHSVIDRYFVTMFYVSDFYICLGGIHTESWSISEQERKHGSTAYYLYHTDTDELAGPYWDLNAFERCCNTKDFSVENSWLFVSDYQ